MATQSNSKPASEHATSRDLSISVRVIVDGDTLSFKLPLKDIVPQVLPSKARSFLGVSEDTPIKWERYSNTTMDFVPLESYDIGAYRALYRSAKHKSKCTLRATIGPQPSPQIPLSSYQYQLMLLDARNKRRLLGAKGGSETTLVNVPTVPPTVPEPLVPVAPSPAPCVAGPSSEPQASAVASPPRQPSPPKEPVSMGAAEAEEPGRATLEDEVKTLLDKHIPQLNTESPESRCPKPQSSPTTSTSTKDSPDSPDNPDSPDGPDGSNKREFPVFIRTGRLGQAFKLPASVSAGWTVYCNNCEKSALEEHYHCNICDEGDYDLCPSCMDKGVHCPGENHWLIKRFFKDGRVTASTTETFPPKPRVEAQKEMPGAFTEEKKVEEEEPEPSTRTCNCCVNAYPDDKFVTCVDCEDYDLCFPCLEDGKHGHHPAHRFEAAVKDAVLSGMARHLCAAGRNLAHRALCDGCDKNIIGVRNKCLVCPDWDYCSECMKTSRITHPKHRFAPIYDYIPLPEYRKSRHSNIYCDGPLCIKNTKTEIRGERYKCTVCPDYDLCENCEKSPLNKHNETHPMLKFKTPVGRCDVSTISREEDGVYRRVGDWAGQPPESCCMNNATTIQTIADVKPSEPTARTFSKEKIAIKDLLTEPVQEKTKLGEIELFKGVGSMGKPNDVLRPCARKTFAHRFAKPGELTAHFIKDAIPDGYVVKPEEQFCQVWTLRNPGPEVWPSGCSVRYVGGDNMLDIDNGHPASNVAIVAASESNTVPRPVYPGEEIDFRVTMKAPKREGLAISYWRLKAADGTPFGHRLWCHINVVKAGAEVSQIMKEPKAEDVPKFDQTADLDNVSAQTLQLMQEDLHKKICTRECKQQLAKELKQLVEEPPVTTKRWMEAGEKPVPFEQEPEQNSKDEPVKSEPTAGASDSKMVFPRLEKESPAASVHGVKADAPKPEPETKTPKKEEEELFEDAESVSLDDDESFLTDEEYDILDASDEEAT